MLARVAASVIGVDVSEEAVNHARDKYRLENLEFQIGDCAALPLPDSSVDLAVCFETLEHHSSHEAMLAELRRVLTPNGVLLVSTPDRKYYSDQRGYANPFHVRELYADEFRRLILNFFPHAAFYGQRVVYGSVAASFSGGGDFVSFSGDGTDVSQFGGVAAPFYLLSVASAASVPTLPASLFDGSQASQREAEALLKELAEAKDQLARTRLQLDSVYASIYWRLTYPLRLLRKGLKRAFGI